MATHGDTRLGGDDWDQRIVDWLVEQFAAVHGIDLSLDGVARLRLADAAERAKIDLSAARATTIEVPYIAVAGGQSLHLAVDLSRDRFHELTADLLDRCRATRWASRPRAAS